MNDCSLPEHPNDFWKRLKDIGEWAKARDYFERKRQSQYNALRTLSRSKGGKLGIDQRVEANKNVWDMMFEQWPPPDDAKPLESLRDFLLMTKHVRKRTEMLPKLTALDCERFDEIGETDDYEAEVNWVYHNRTNQSVEACDCPSRGAWGLLEEARKNPEWFLEKVFRPLAQQMSKQKQAAAEEAYKPSKAEKMAVAELEEMIKEAVEATQQ